MIQTAAVALVLLCGGSFVYAYLGYPALLQVLATLTEPYSVRTRDPEEWPLVSVSLPVHDEEAVIEETLENLLAVDYPADRLQIVVVSDASTDRTDEIVRSYRDRGVQLVRQEERAGKTAAENAAVPHLEGDIVVNTDASTRVAPGALRPLVRALGDPAVGVASARDRSVGPDDADPLRGESRYVGYEMAVRDLETRVGGLVGASGCLYAIRRHLHDRPVPPELSRDFTAALHARAEGYRCVSVPDAVALVPRARSLRAEYRRKVRTMVRGLDSLWFRRELLDPLRHGRFAWMLASHKLARWLVPATLPLAIAGLAVLAAGGSGLAAAALAAAALLALATGLALAWPEGRGMPRPVSFAGYAGVGLAAGVAAWSKVLLRDRSPVWEPTRRESGAVPD